MSAPPYDCQACGACCAYDPEWPALVDPADRGPTGPDPAWVDGDHMAWTGQACIALDGIVGEHTACRIYERRPSPCRACQAGSVPCHVARRAHGLPVDEAPSGLDALFG